MPVSTIQKYLAMKLELSSENEVSIFLLSSYKAEKISSFWRYTNLFDITMAAHENLEIHFRVPSIKT